MGTWAACGAPGDDHAGDHLDRGSLLCFWLRGCLEGSPATMQSLESWSTAPEYRPFFRDKVWGGFGMLAPQTGLNTPGATDGVPDWNAACAGGGKGNASCSSRCWLVFVVCSRRRLDCLCGTCKPSAICVLCSTPLTVVTVLVRWSSLTIDTQATEP